MHPSNRFAQLCASLAVAGLVTAPAIAQPAAPPFQASDPPSRVGRLARLQGTVSFRTADADQWSPATRNFPIVSGNDLWTEPQSGARVEFAASAVTLAASTEFDVDRLQPSGLAATQPQGEVFLQLRRLARGETETIQTPRGTVTIAANGLYEIAAGDTQTPTSVTVIEGTAQVGAETVSLQVAAGQTASVTGAGSADAPLQGSVGPAARDAFLDAMLSAIAPRKVARRSEAPAAVATMPGAEDLAASGSWQPSPQYGTVWYPQVAPDWVPYRDGHWAYVTPWGWTWVDDEPWGYAPFHYGRWVQTGERWGWAPAYVGQGGVGNGGGYSDQGYEEPVYAPALVTFLDVGVGVATGLAIGSALHRDRGHDRTGWAPLGWDQPYRPWYRGSDRYVRDINRTSVSNVNNITNVRNENVIVNNFNRRGVTVAPTAAVVGSQPIGPRAQSVSNQQAATLRPAARPDFRPVAATAGVTSALARRLGVTPATAVARPAPGPAPNPARIERAANLRAPGATPPAPGAPPRLPAATPNAAGLPALRGAGTPVGAVGPQPPQVCPAEARPAAARPPAPGPAILPRAAGGAVPSVAGLAAGQPTALPVLRGPAPSPAAGPAARPASPGAGRARPGQLPGAQPTAPRPGPGAIPGAVLGAVPGAHGPAPMPQPQAPAATPPATAPARPGPAAPALRPPAPSAPVAPRVPPAARPAPPAVRVPDRVTPPLAQQPRFTPPPARPVPPAQPRFVPPPAPVQQPRFTPPPPPPPRAAPPPPPQQPPRFTPPPPRAAPPPPQRAAPPARPAPACTRQPCR